MNSKEEGEALAIANKAVDRYKAIAVDYDHLADQYKASEKDDFFLFSLYTGYAIEAWELVKLYQKKVDRLSRW